VALNFSDEPSEKDKGFLISSRVTAWLLAKRRLPSAVVTERAFAVGRVTWIRLHCGSYVLETNGEQHELACPSCEPTDNNTGLAASSCTGRSN
jgi:hypothetical protein